MNKIKIDDWVTPSGKPFNRFKGIKQISNIKGNSYLIGTSWCVENDFELWTPKKGEWCWFKDRYHKNYILGQYKYTTQSNKFRIINDDRPIKHSMEDNLFDFCEPFIGEVPTAIQEQVDE